MKYEVIFVENKEIHLTENENLSHSVFIYLDENTSEAAACVRVDNSCSDFYISFQYSSPWSMSSENICLHM